MKEEIAIRLRELLASLLWTGQDAITSESDADSLGMDSLDKIEVILGVEDRFGIVISEGEADRIKSFGDLVGLVYRKLKEKKGGRG